MSRLLVLGNAGLDISLPVPRLPKPGETLLGGATTRAPGGKGLNQATVAARMGLLPVAFLAPVGDDAEGREITRCLRDEGFSALDLCPVAGATDLSILLISPDGENSIVTSGICAASLSADAARDFASGLRPGEWLLLQGNLSFAATAAAIEAASRNGARVMINPAPLDAAMAALLPCCDVVVVNTVEARALTGEEGSSAARTLRARGVKQVVVTLGHGGCLVAEGNASRHLPAWPARAVDTTGAGDTFCGVLVALLATGRTLDAAAVPAQRAAALTVSRPGAFAALPDVAELRALLEA